MPPENQDTEYEILCQIGIHNGVRQSPLMCALLQHPNGQFPDSPTPICEFQISLEVHSTMDHRSRLTNFGMDVDRSTQKPNFWHAYEAFPDNHSLIQTRVTVVDRHHVYNIPVVTGHAIIPWIAASSYSWEPHTNDYTSFFVPRSIRRGGFPITFSAR